MFQNDNNNNVCNPAGSVTIPFATFTSPETKEQMVERLVKDGKISLREAFVLMDKTMDLSPFVPLQPYFPIQPYVPYVPYDPPYQPWWTPYTGPIVTYCGERTSGGFSNITAEA